MFRLIFLTFYGEERLTPRSQAHLHESPPVDDRPARRPGRSSRSWPATSACRPSWASGPISSAASSSRSSGPGREQASRPATEWLLILASTSRRPPGHRAGLVFSIRSPPRCPAGWPPRFPWLHRLLCDKYYVDEIYDAVFVRPLVRGSELVYRALRPRGHRRRRQRRRPPRPASPAGPERLSRPGLIKDYALAFLLGVVVFLGLILLGYEHRRC